MLICFIILEHIYEPTASISRFPEQPTVIAGCFVWQSCFKQRDTLPRAPTGYFHPFPESSLSACRLFHTWKWKRWLISISPRSADSQTENERQYRIKYGRRKLSFPCSMEEGLGQMSRKSWRIPRFSVGWMRHSRI